MRRRRYLLATGSALGLALLAGCGREDDGGGGGGGGPYGMAAGGPPGAGPTPNRDPRERTGALDGE